MANTSGSIQVGETAAQLGARMSRLIVARRTAKRVGAAMNGEPNPPSTSRGQHVRRECQRAGGYAGCEGLAALDLADYGDGVPVDELVAPYEAHMAALRALAAAPNIERPLDAYQVPEMKHEAALNVVQRVLDRNQDSPDAHEAVARHGRAYRRFLNELIAYCDQRSVVLRGIARPVYGATMARRIRAHL